MKSKFPVHFFIIDCILITVVAVLLINMISFFNCIKFSKNMRTEPSMLMRIHMYGHSEQEENSTVSANITLLDSALSEISTIERSWNGTFLAIDFSTTCFWNNTFYFPLKVYGTDTVSSKYNYFSPKKGTKLSPYYIENRECLLSGANRSVNDKKYLKKLKYFSTSPLAFFLKGFAKKITVNLSRCESGKTYGLFITESGELMLSPL